MAAMVCWPLASCPGLNTSLRRSVSEFPEPKRPSNNLNECLLPGSQEVIVNVWDWVKPASINGAISEPIGGQIMISCRIPP